jgi:hypothetical protein
MLHLKEIVPRRIPRKSQAQEREILYLASLKIRLNTVAYQLVLITMPGARYLYGKPKDRSNDTPDPFIPPFIQPDNHGFLRFAPT